MPNKSNQLLKLNSPGTPENHTKMNSSNADYSQHQLTDYLPANAAINKTIKIVIELKYGLKKQEKGLSGAPKLNAIDESFTQISITHN